MKTESERISVYILLHNKTNKVVCNTVCSVITAVLYTSLSLLSLSVLGGRRGSVLMPGNKVSIDPVPLFPFSTSLSYT